MTDIDYDAKGQRTRSSYGNGVRTDLRLRPADLPADAACRRRRGARAPAGPGYTYDPAGNITQHPRRRAADGLLPQPGGSSPAPTTPTTPLYRLVEATGREHLGQAGAHPQTTWDDAPRIGLPASADGKAHGPLRRAVRLRRRRQPAELRPPRRDRRAGWTRDYALRRAEPARAGRASNRLTSDRGRRRPRAETVHATTPTATCRDAAPAGDATGTTATSCGVAAAGR